MTETPADTALPPPSTPPPGPPPYSSPPLFRSLSDRKVAGVCGGVGLRLGIDPLILRVIIVVLSIFGGSGLVLYALGWLLIPEEGADRSVAQRAIDQNGRPGDRNGLATIIIGVLAGLALLLLLGGLLSSVGLGHDGYSVDLWPLVVIGGIAAAVWYSSRPGTGSAGGSPRPLDPPTTPYATTSATTYATPASTYATPGSAPYGPYAQSAPPRPPRPRRQRSVLSRLTLSVAALAAGIMVLLDRTGAIHLRATVFLAVLLTITGLGLLVGAFVGRGRGLIVWGVLLALLTAGSAATSNLNLQDTGRVTWQPLTVSAVPVDGYSWGTGDVALDLTRLPANPSPNLTNVTAQLGAGTMVVTVPAGAWFRVKAHVGVGTIRLPDGQGSDGLAKSSDTTFGSDLSAPTHRLILDLTVGAGTVEVRRASS